MTRILAILILVAIIFTLAAPSFAQTTVYKCGTTYSDQPCDGATILNVAKDQNVIQFRIPVSPTPEPTTRGYVYDPSLFATGFNLGNSGGYTSYGYSTPYGNISSPVPLSMSTRGVFDRRGNPHVTSFTLDGTTYHTTPGNLRGNHGGFRR